MKRGLIVWDEGELPRSVLERRLEQARAAASVQKLDAIVVYTDVWRSNRARSLVNFMPFWGRSLLVLPREERPILLCGNSPRVYPWLGTVTFVEELRPTKDFGARLLELASEQGWTRLGVLDLPKLPYDIDRALVDSPLELVDVEPWEGLAVLDESELAMRRTALAKARALVEARMAQPGKCTERRLVADLERALRRAGMEDVLIRVSRGLSAPGLPSESDIDETTSALVACEYRGHWVQLARPAGRVGDARQRFLEALNDSTQVRGKLFDLAGSFPFQAIPQGLALGPGRLLAIHLELDTRRYFGDTCLVRTASSVELL